MSGRTDTRASPDGARPAVSAWAPFRHRIYRSLWIAQFAGNIGTWAQTVGAQWLMGDLGGGPLLVALVQTATTLPVFLLVVPAGGLGDIVDRRRLLLAGQSVMVVASAVLAVVTFAGGATPLVLLAATAALAVGTALSQPTFAAIQPELVTRDEIPEAALLNGASVNIARAVGPAFGGLLISAVGPAGTFALNAASFLGIIGVLFLWKRPADDRPLGSEHIQDAIVAGVRYTRNAPGFLRVLGRSFLFIVFASAVWTLLAVVARGPLGLGPSGYGILLGSIGIGAVFGTTVVIPALRRRIDTNSLVALGSITYGAGLVVVGLGAPAVVTVATLAVVGMAWISVTSSVNASAQLLLPNWTRARALSFMTLVFQGGQAIGSVLWGAIAGLVDVRTAFAIAGAGQIIAAVVGVARLPLRPAGDVRWTRYWPEPHVVIEIEPGEGPVLVTVEWRIDPARTQEFAEAMRAVGQARRQTGATRWSLFQDAREPAVFLETFTVDTWYEHLRQHVERGTVMDKQLEARARAFLAAETEPRPRHLVWAYHVREDRPRD